MYLSFERYKEFGGELEENEFIFNELLARKKLDYWTLGRVGNFLEENKNNINLIKTIEDIELSMFLIIEEITSIRKGETDVSSFSNDGISVTLANPKTNDEKLANIYQQVVEILPIELVSIAI